MSITVRPAQRKDYPAVARILRQIAQLHADLRPDIFRPASQKYGKKQFAALLKNKETPILIAQNEQGEMLGYAMLRVMTIRKNPVFCPRQFLHVDDLCVDETSRGLGIGTALMGGVRELAEERGIRKIQLNVWGCNQGALKFYERQGFQTQRRQLELDL